MKFCDKTIENVSEGIEKIKRELNQQLNYNEREEIISALVKNDKLNKKHTEQRKRKKFNYLKYKPKIKNTSKKNEPPHQTERPTSEHQKPPYSSVLNRKSNTNLRRKFSKQNLAYNDNTKLNKPY